jgi:SAM-dependent methyltransferase
MEHDRVVQAEFARQAQAFAHARHLQAPEITLRIADALEPSKTARVLDVACGPGVLTAVLCERAGHVVGLDLTAEVLRLARARDGVTNAAFVQGRVAAAPFALHAFDAAVIRLALHHFERPDLVLAEVRRVLRPGGRLVVLDVLTCEDGEQATLHNAIECLRDPSHVALVPQAALRAQVLDAGFALRSESAWESVRDFLVWAEAIAEPKRMAALELLLRHFARAGIRAGIDLREEAGTLRLTYRIGLFVAEAV